MSKFGEKVIVVGPSSGEVEVKSSFNKKIISANYNYSSDFFELRAQQGRSGLPIVSSTDIDLELKGSLDSELVSYNRTTRALRYTGGILFGTTDPPSPAGLIDGTLYFKYT